ncbi:MAG: hypothetical protein AAFR59_02940 [Bacteroidota bacterium]
MRPLNFSHAIALFFLLWTLSACEGDPYPIQADFEPINTCWAISDTLRLDNPTPNLGVSIKLKQDYDYQNIYLKALASDAEGKQVEWTQNIRVMSPGGEWLDFEGKAKGMRTKMGDQYRIIQPITFENFSPTSVALFHFMREESLCGVTSVQLVDMGN